MRVPVLIALGAMAVLAGCEKRTALPARAADSTATAADSTAADSTVRDSGTTSAAPKAPAKTASDSIIGHDSAYGPIGMVDSTGKIVPLRTKRP
jgi:hypothetical protein